MARWAPSLVIVLSLVACAGCDISSAALDHTKESAATSSPVITLERSPDREIEQRLLGILAEIDGLSDVKVQVSNGVVDLSGETDTVAQELRAGALASRIAGVVHVDDNIRQRSGAHAWFAPTWSTLRRVGHAAVNAAPQVIAAMVMFLPFLLLARLVREWRRPFHILGARQLTGSIVRFALRGVIVIGGLLLAFDVLGIMGLVGAVVGALGLVGLVAGFAFKDWVAEYFPGMMLGLHPPFNAGDLVQIGAYEGRVVRITPRSTVMMTTDGEELRMPNSTLYRQTLVNYSHHRERRLRIVIPVAPWADLGKVAECGRHTLLELRGVMSDPAPFMRTRAIEHQAVEVEYFAWVDQDVENFRTVESRAKRAVLEALTRAGVQLPENSMVIRFWRPRATRHGRGDADRIARSEHRDREFVDHQLENARRTPGERDLLEEGRRPARAPRGGSGAPR